MKILITSLGTGDKTKGYSKANYKLDDKLYENEELISKALSRHLKVDKLFVVGTTASIWDSVYRGFGGEDEDTELNLLQKQESKTIDDQDLKIVSSQIDKHLYTSGSGCFLINYGLDEEQIWENFKKYLDIAEKIGNGDELYLDITHSFRSLSLMSFMMVQFIEQIKDKNIKT